MNYTQKTNLAARLRVKEHCYHTEVSGSNPTIAQKGRIILILSGFLSKRNYDGEWSNQFESYGKNVLGLNFLVLHYHFYAKFNWPH